MNNRIEYSILQQLIYKEKQETLYNSRLKGFIINQFGLNMFYHLQ